MSPRRAQRRATSDSDSFVDQRGIVQFIGNDGRTVEDRVRPTLEDPSGLRELAHCVSAASYAVPINSVAAVAVVEHRVH
jgi:hypothetical protein